jgi:hypothetical protein
MTALEIPIRAATETAAAHGVVPDRCEILQNGSTLVLRLSETLVARVVTDLDGPRRGLEWFSREIAVARHLAERGAPVIPLHPDLPPGPHEHLGHPLNFWKFVTACDADPDPVEIGRTLHRCHELLRSFPQPLPVLAVLGESLELLRTLEERQLFPPPTARLLRERLSTSLEALRAYPHQPLHGDAHPGNLMNTAAGLLWTDWEDAFAGPVEWDLASIIWNARILDHDDATADAILEAYRIAGGQLDPVALQHSLVARAAVMSIWYPVLYPEPSPERRRKLQSRLDWLEGAGSAGV